MAQFAERKAVSEKKERSAKVEERLKHRIIDGDRQGLEADLDEALTNTRRSTSSTFSCSTA